MRAWNNGDFVQEYWQDAWQRSILCMDVLRQRGNIYREHSASAVPNVLKFKAELVVDGRKLPRPVNYALVRIVPPAGTITHPAKPPFIVVDPRAGHGPGIGGMKNDSEIGVALAAGYPCYFIGFLPDPVPGQTVDDVCRAEAIFIEAAAAQHPQAESKPVIVANCQAGWQIMMMAAINPNLTGPIMLAGSPLSYWAGVRGKNPLRYLGGLLGGSWLTALAGDRGAGIFDGADLVANFESLNPANTYWDKPYNVYSNVDTEAPRFLEFETWWGSPVLLNAGEMQWIADNLFVGNKLASGALRTSDGVRIDLRNIKSPIIVFCSWGDNITPPQQALDWILDLYDDDREIVANGQTIVYSLHQSIGHLGIFVSGKVATKEHSKFTACMNLINLLPPGLYEAVITNLDATTPNPNLIGGDYLLKLEPRTMNDIRALGVNSREDDLRFATVRRISEINLALYKKFVRPGIRATVSESSAEMRRFLHPNRLRFAIFSDRNPFIAPIAAAAKLVRSTRQPAAADNPLLRMEKLCASAISTWLETLGTARDAMMEAVFLTTYGSSALQAMVGLGRESAAADHRVDRDLVREADEARSLSQLEKQFEAGGPIEAAVRAVMYVNLPEGGIDERGFNLLKEFRASRPAKERRSLAELKDLLKEQSLLIRLDEERAVQAIPKLVSGDHHNRRSTLNAVRKIVEARGTPKPQEQSRFHRIEVLFNGASDHLHTGAAHA